MSTEAGSISAVPTSEADARRGFLFALAAYLLWGFLPLYMKAIAHIPAMEVVAHRILWSVPIAGLLLVWLGRTADIRAALRSPRILAMGALTAALITINWGIYVWAIGNGRALESALGYYINPLFSVLLGAVVLGEKLSKLQMAAIALAVSAVAILTWETGGLPWVSVGLAVSWGFYALFKKTLPIGPAQGFFLEVLLLTVPALAAIAWFETTGQGHFGDTGWVDVALLLGCGIVTAIPLILYANGAKLLKLSTIGMMQYIAPTMIFFTAVFIFKEPFSSERAVAFGLIWAALALYTIGMFKSSEKA
ncbi:EamA family transporter RarD [Salmonella enterica subsp. enterica serovar Virchow]|nr:EamA family transporter RarD [Salmonella enterica subsp. enterica serovar Typhi]EBV3599894.1 EamA family transporter RarD [Salmonella enterica subsp. enterica serovar Virchow]